MIQPRACGFINTLGAESIENELMYSFIKGDGDKMARTENVSKHENEEQVVMTID